MPASIIRFLNQVAAQPDHIAVCEAERTVTYGELGTLCRRLAARIAGVQPRVAIVLPPGPEAYASCFATLMAGGYYVPLDPEMATDDRNRILETFAPDILVAAPATAQACKNGHSAAVIDPYTATGDQLAQPLPPHRLALVRFETHGDRPSGVMISHEALDNHVGCLLRESGITPDDRWSQVTDIGADQSIADIFGGLCGGATLYPIPGDNPATALQASGLTVWHTNAAQLAKVVDTAAVEALTKLRLVILSGGAVRPELLDRTFAANPNLLILRTFGIAEAGASCSTLLHLYNDNFKTACATTVAIGKPIDNVHIHLVGGTSPEEGELVISGLQLADGYWNDPEATEESFRPLEEGGAPAYFTKQWAERMNGHIFIRPDHKVAAA